jgi:hypothetical protein
MNANEARKSAVEHLLGDVPQKEYELIMETIKHRVTIGDFRLWQEDISKPVRLKLRSEGYCVKWSFWSGGYNITWK